MTITPESSDSYSLNDVDLDTLVDWNALPQGLQELKNTVGSQAAILLARTCGGGNLYVPVRPRPDSPAFKKLDHDMLHRLSQAFGGMTLNIPKADAVYRQLRHQAIHEGRAHGASVASLAAKYNLSRRRILQILAGGSTRRVPQKSYRNPLEQTHL